MVLKSIARNQDVGDLIALTVNTDNMGSVFQAPIRISADTGHRHACLQKPTIHKEEPPFETIREDYCHRGLSILIPFDAVAAFAKRRSTFLSTGN